MKTLIKPQSDSTIAICRNNSAKNKIELVQIKQKRYQFKLISIILPLSLLVFLMVPDSPQELSSICNKYNSIEACNVW